MYHSFYISYLIPQLIFHSNSAWGTFIEIVAPFKYFTHVISKKSCAHRECTVLHSSQICHSLCPILNAFFNTYFFLHAPESRA